MKVTGKSLWMVVNPTGGGVIYVAAASQRRAEFNACMQLGKPRIERSQLRALGYRAVKVTAITYEGETDHERE